MCALSVAIGTEEKHFAIKITYPIDIIRALMNAPQFFVSSTSSHNGQMANKQDL